MKFLRPFSWVAVGSLIVWSLPARATVLDSFSGTSASDVSNYTAYLAFGSPAATFAINNNDQFQPSSGLQTTTDFIWNQGAVLSDSVFGESVSVDIDQVDNSAAAGLALSTSTSGANYILLAITETSNNGPTDASVTNITPAPTLDVNFTGGDFITETITRNSNTGFTLTFSGDGLSYDGGDTYTTTFTDANLGGENVYFGLAEYSGINADHSAGNEIEDNLDYAIVPEPSTCALLFAILACVGLYLRRKGGLIAG